MKRTLFLLPLLLLVAAAPAWRVENLVRRGNDAFEAGEYAAAIQLYKEAEPSATDPGLVAFNKAAAFYRQAVTATVGHRNELFQQAEKHYRRAAEGAGNPRRLWASFGLANSILQGQPEAAALREAIACYRECLASPDVEEALAANARHNLEVAKLRLIRALERSQNPNKPPEDQGGDNPQRKQPDDKDPQQPQTGDGPKKGARTPTGQEQPAEKDGQKARPIDEKSAGGGNQKVLGDDTPSPPLSAEDADAELTKAADEILKEQRARRFRAGRTLPGIVKDW